MIEEHLGEPPAVEGEEEHMHTHKLWKMGTPHCHAFPWRTRTSPPSHAETKAVLNPAFPGNRTPGIHQTYGGRRPGLQRSANPAAAVKSAG